MSAKHTPGPWKVKVEREGGINSAARIVTADPGNTVAYVGGDDTVEDAKGRIWESLSAEGERNARPDGSSIVVAGPAWDLGLPGGCFCWAGAGHAEECVNA